MVELLLAVQIECLARAVFAESRGESYGGQVLVGAVVKNRVLDDRFESDICRVIEEPYQFSFVHEVSEYQLEKAIENEPEAWERAVRVAESVVNSGAEPLFENILYYHATSIKPGWNYSVIEEVNTVGQHVFYIDRGN